MDGTATAMAGAMYYSLSLKDPRRAASQRTLKAGRSQRLALASIAFALALDLHTASSFRPESSRALSFFVPSTTS